MTTDSRLSPWPGSRSWFSAIPERSSSRVRKLWAGRSSAVRFVAAFRRADSDGRAFSTGVLRAARALSMVHGTTKIRGVTRLTGPVPICLAQVIMSQPVLILERSCHLTPRILVVPRYATPSARKGGNGFTYMYAGR